MGRIVRPIVGYVRTSIPVAFYAYLAERKEPTRIMEHCCPDGGSDLFVAVSGKDGRTPVLLVAWGMEEDRARRSEWLTRWGVNVAAYLNAR
jgi:hypothetical protein